MAAFTKCALLLSMVILNEAAFTTTPGTVAGCRGSAVTLAWVYENVADANLVVWDFGSTNVFNYQPSSGSVVAGGSYTGRVTHNGNGSITLDSLTDNDAGSYTCTVSYNSNPSESDTATLEVNEPFTGSVSTILTISGSKATVNLGSQGGVDVEWKNEAGTVVGTGTTYTGEGKITVCLTGCVSGSATTCQQIDLGSPSTSEATSTTVNGTTPDKDHDNTLIIAVCASVGGVVVIAIIVFIICIVTKSRKKRNHDEKEMEGVDNNLEKGDKSNRDNSKL